MKTLAIASAALGLLLALVLEGNFLHVLVLCTVAVYLVAPAILIIGSIWLWSWFRQVERPWLRKAWAIIGIAVVTGFASGGLGFTLHQFRKHETRSFVARAVAYLDTERARTGKYPSSLPETDFGRPPPWLSQPHPWTLSADAFRFEYWDPSGLMNGYEFTSSTREWISFD